LFNSTPTPPATAPAAEKPAETPAATPATPPAAKPAGDDLFGAPAAEKPAITPEKPPEKPAATPAAPESKPAAGDDLFGAPSAEKAAPAEKPAAPAEKPAEKPADKPAGEQKKDEKKSDDIFGSSSSVLHESGGLASNEMRKWVDNTGNFSCQGRLIRLVDSQVQLLKDNGRTTTVSLSRLSANDLRFVERQASAKHATAFQTAQSTTEMPWMAN
jgi:hypothetical protein